MADEEKQTLLPAEQKINEGKYGGVEPEAGETSETSPSDVKGFLHRHKEKIPGYGMLQLVKQGGVYSLYVLLALLVVYLFNQLDRYTLPIVTTSVGRDLRYGDKTCQSNPHVNSSLLEEAKSLFNFTADCGSADFQ